MFFMKGNVSKQVCVAAITLQDVMDAVRAQSLVIARLFFGSLARAGLTLLLVFIASGTAVASPQSEQQILEVFVRDGCPHCADAKQYLPSLARQYPNLRIVYRSLDTDPRAADTRLWRRG